MEDPQLSRLPETGLLQLGKGADVINELNPSDGFPLESTKSLVS